MGDSLEDDISTGPCDIKTWIDEISAVFFSMFGAEEQAENLFQMVYTTRP